MRLNGYISWHLCLVILLISVNKITCAQDVEEDFKRVAENYSSGNYSLEVEYTFFGGHEGVISLDKQTSYIKKNGKNFHTKQFGTEVLTDDKMVLIIDESNKMLVINKKHKEASEKEKEKAKEQVDQLYQQLYSSLGIDPEKMKPSKGDINTSYLGDKNGRKGYRFTYSHGDYEFLDFYFNSKSNLVTEVWMFYRQPMELEEGVYKKPKVKLTYKNQNINPSFLKDEFSIKKHLKIGAKGEVEITNQKYKDFELINQMIN